MINRARNDIIAEMLRPLLKKEASRTRLMYYAMLSNEQSKSYMVFLLEKGLILQSEPKQFIITDKGREFLNIIDEMNSMVTIGVEASAPGMGYHGLTDIDHKAIEMTTKPKVNLSREEGRAKPSKSLKETARLVSEKVIAMKNGTVTKTRERQDVLTLWNSGMHNTVKIAKVLDVGRGVVYNHLRRLGIKKKG